MPPSLNVDEYHCAYLCIAVVSALRQHRLRTSGCASVVISLCSDAPRAMAMARRVVVGILQDVRGCEKKIILALSKTASFDCAGTRHQIAQILPGSQDGCAPPARGGLVQAGTHAPARESAKWCTFWPCGDSVVALGSARDAGSKCRCCGILKPPLCRESLS